MGDQVEERLKFYEEGAKPRKNIEVMHEALGEYKSFVESNKNNKVVVKEEKVNGDHVEVKSEKKKKKKKKSLAAASEVNGSAEVKVEVKVEEETPKKKKKKKSLTPKEEPVNGSAVEVAEVKVESETPKKKKKKKSLVADEVSTEVKV